MDDKLVDIEKLLKSKNPKAHKWTPKFLLNYLKRVIHEDEVNLILHETKDKYDYEFCQDIIERFNIKVELEGLEKMPKTGGCIFALNHGLGGMDAIAIISAIHHYRPDIKFLVNDLLLNLKSLKGMFVGVNKHGRNTSGALSSVNDLFASEQAIFVFPAGLVSRKSKGKVQDLTWKKTFITRAKKHNKPIMPIYLDGELSNFFYRLANFRTWIGIKANLEMLYLADEQFKMKNKTIRITFGDLVEAETFDDSKTDLEWAQVMKEKVYNLQS